MDNKLNNIPNNNFNTFSRQSKKHKMGVINSVEKRIEQKQLDAAIRQQLLSFKKLKRRRDYEIATKIATTRDRVYWMCGFYGAMGTASIGRMIYLREFNALPLKYVPFVLVPFLVAYQADFAWGTKVDRIDKEARKILKSEKHWFTEPMELSPLLQEHYMTYWTETNKKLEAKGYLPESHWASFPDANQTTTTSNTDGK
jgi:hypothetical protein